MDIGFRLPPGTIPPGDLAARAESLGYTAVWTGELWEHDPFVTLASAAAATDQVTLGTAVVNVYSRTPAVLAMAAATLDAVSDGRARLGLGASTAQAIEGIHGLSYERPVRRTHETVEVITQLFNSDDPVEYHGDLLSVEGVPPLDTDVPIHNAALGPANRRVTGRLCDGWLPHNIPQFALEDAFEGIASAAREAGRSPDAIEVIPYVPTAVADEAATARSLLQGHIAYYVGSGAGYRRAVADQFPDPASAVAERWADGDREAAREAVTDEMVDSLGVAGTPAMVREQLREWSDRPIVDELLVVPAGQPDEARIWATVEAGAPDG